MESPKVEIYNTLKDATTADVVQQSKQNVFTTFPVVTYFLANNNVVRDLDNEIASQDITVTVDIWTETSAEGQTILTAIEQAMANVPNKNYRLEFSADVPNPNEEIYHITCRFIAVNV